MPKRKSRTPSPAALGLLAVSALALFLVGEALLLSGSESGQLALARRFGFGQPARITQLVGRQLRRGLAAAGIPADSVRESTVEGADPPVRWRVGLRPGASLLQTNYTVTRTLERHGATVLRGHEGWTPAGAQVVTLLVGLPRRPTHQLRLVRMAENPAHPTPNPARLALVLYGLGEDPAAADSFFVLPVPFAVALAPGHPRSAAMFQAAHRRSREVVLHVPLEPINYPQVNPGPGTLLVTMRPARISSELRRYLDQADPVAAVANHMGSLATQDMTVMKAVYHELKRSHLPFLHVAPVAGAVCRSLATDMGVVYREPDVMVDGGAGTDGTEALDRRWSTVLKLARERGGLLVMMRATPRTRLWLPRALDRERLSGVSLVPLSALVHRPAPL